MLTLTAGATSAPSATASPRIAGRANAECRAVPVTDPQAVSSVIEKFRAKYGDGGVKLYGKFAVAVLVEVR